MEKIKNFVESWQKRGYEKGETHSFWLSFLRDVLKISEPEKIIQFEVPVKLKHKSFIDAFLPDTKIIIEQKSSSVNLSQEKNQSDGEILTPFEQAQRYGVGLPVSMHPHKIIVCNFKEFLIYDMELMNEPTKIFLEELPEKFSAFDFMIDAKKSKIRFELEISLKAGEIVGKIYDALKKNYLNPDSEESLQSLNKLCVRLVFCLYAESSGMFGKRKIFRDYLQGSRNIRRDLILLFEILNTPEKNRDEYLEDELKIFPYVNGGLFADENIEIPNFSDEIKKILFDEAENFNWSGISPTIFGAVFESTLNPITRREGGMHYTSIENIHKVIDNLFLNDLNAEFISCKKNRKKLLAFQEKISQLKFFDPACGSGNFLTESFISLRRLENKILKEILQEKILLGELDNPIKVSINQFFGIEINDFACSVAQTALWIAELQTAQETQKIIHKNLNFLPLKNFTNIFEGNALRMDWQKIFEIGRCEDGQMDSEKNSTNLPIYSLPDYIFGNPPFVGKSFQTPAQKADMKKVFDGVKNFGNLDYVACWYKKAADFLYSKNSDENNFCTAKNPDEGIKSVQKLNSPNKISAKIQCAFVSTNSICQGIAVPPLWNYLLQHKIFINFAHQTFVWDSESTDKAHVHCVVVGFSAQNIFPKKLFTPDGVIECENINPYLLPAPNIIVQPQEKSFYDVPPMFVGSCPTDGGNLILSEDEKNFLLKKFPDSKKFLKIYLGGDDFLHNKKRFCLWLKDASPTEIKKIPPIFQRVQQVKIFRQNSKKIQTQHRADTPHLFAEDRFISAKKIFIPRTTSSEREYIPMGFIEKDIVANLESVVIPNADLFLFGILISKVHMALLKKFCGRLGNGLRYSATIIYNTFPFPEEEKNIREKISATAGKILDARKNFPDSTLADLYNPTLMPKILREAHKKNDRAVMAAYNFDFTLSENEIVGELMNLYKNFPEK